MSLAGNLHGSTVLPACVRYLAWLEEWNTTIEYCRIILGVLAPSKSNMKSFALVGVININKLSFLLGRFNRT